MAASLSLTQHDTSSPLQFGPVPADTPWAEEKVKFDAIFDSLSPVGGMLTGDKVKPVLLNSKLPVDVLGRVWELSDIDRDGMLDKDEFAVYPTEEDMIEWAKRESEREE
ncbi:epidermal growth factor receptor substrate 15-like isoform X2 [Danio rerio]|uniref:Epidermal growth factor receptor substrate 15-like isoform X2 n=1 Tax=Danio rerio TaxID=7955 RepID=A0AC58G981_DANRE